ncbi:putative bifunctional diguanylate cyclase/phosphodiesterase [Rhodospirillum rubrum]|uniref:Diguanylate cyclase/phosphodiesterase n=1 Tax=Rhodospirillum rubrum (strain ATCC 11170 / ATH 1.1.1 / DSM 467 / LMG 4362 / NCIMB 8255 / S1) TaxID=269796 RepID=Q2RR44_RHORT|nr:EAL domain-containing protein [Rhodospirillum rubrum]ABC23401.1 diguanylate cyclase/phosphodiesterase [Rhodospirillum rubrum ATCC 11170]AEO49137.1 diguanylate cyclase/phosphodiesterase [Rhodospirillum rubrum F11]MBK5955051.1 GGDEF-domain containing protein [Rhodospirillum rubrum]QXG79373.1 EAL domain-containing protein [Rhodospirillum rubrum]HCF19594.1 GGDEF-domain containing protein [Rhodospirillum rubrum]
MLGKFLAVQQALRVSLLSLAVSLGFLGMQTVWLASAADRDYLILRDRTASSLQSGLSNALWNFDAETAKAIISDALRANPIRSIHVIDSNGRVFADGQSAQPVVAPSLWESYLGWLVDLKSEMTLDLRFSSPTDDHYQGMVVGFVFITFDKDHFIRGIADRLADQVLGILVIVLVVALTTSIVFHLFISRPIIRVARGVADVDPEDPAATVLTVPRAHQRNEIGRMTNRLNHLLGRLAEVQGELRLLATRDPLTDLPNRSLILEMMDATINRVALDGGRCAVMFLDLDMFKHVNDSLGHEAGDLILKDIGRRFDAVVAGLGAVGRLGGDEFVVLIDRYEREDDLARIARRLITTVKRPIEVDGTLVHSSTSVGIACYPVDGATPQGLLRNADTAMYAVKASGPGQWAFFDRSMTENALVRLRTEASLRSAIEKGQFVLHYQPKLDLRSNRISGCEALIRWDLNGDLVPPGRFISIAEETGMIYDIGLWVLREACQAQRRWRRHAGAVPIAINVSVRQLKDERFIDDFLDIIQASGADPELLEVEVTESALMSSIEVSAHLLREMRSHGVRLSIDDFGTGYSSLAYLKNLPIDILKIDRSFVSDLPEESSIPRMIIGLAGQMGLRTVAEGIETEGQLAWLRDNGCDMIQGFLIEKPLPEADFLRFVDAYRTARAFPSAS